MKRREKSTKQIGDYLLSGWTMLSNHCEKCLSPLMKKNETIECVYCVNEEPELEPIPEETC